MSDFEHNRFEEAWHIVVAVALVVFIGGGLLAWAIRAERHLTTDQVCKKLEQYTISVYAPKSMDEFNEAKEEAVKKGVMTEAVANHFFKAYGDELNEADLSRTCFASATYGAEDMQSDGQARYMVSANLYNAPGANPIKITIEFMPNKDGVISNYNLTVGV